MLRGLSARRVGAHREARGRPLRALVNWEGTDEHGMPWHDSWVGIAMLTADQKAEARRMERESYASVESRQGREKRQKTGNGGSRGRKRPYRGGRID